MSEHAQHVDVLIVGAGLSGISAAYHIQTRCPGRSYAILEGRDAIGGTWDLFRYPGVRSDSDMHTLGYSFRPWRDAKAIADGASILSYIRETASEYGIDRRILFGYQVRRASWSSSEALWTVEAEHGPDRQPARFTCNFLFVCTGYYDYAQGHAPRWPGIERFDGPIVHPQQWPEDLDYAGKRMVVIGSGATAVTLVPALAERAGHVTMLQRSPSYIVALPSQDAAAIWLHRRLPQRLAHRLSRWKAIGLGMYFYSYARRRPETTRRSIMDMARQQLGPDYDVDTHFAPRYDPWDQRLCVAPDADLFKAIRNGAVSIVTDEIDTFTERGIRLRSGDELAADVIVTATGLTLKLMSGIQLMVDGAPVDLAKTLSYRGMMYSDVPNLATALGYTNSSWTLKCELIAIYVCRLLNYMARHGYSTCVARRPAGAQAEHSVLNLTSGYVQRARDILPRQGSKKPWRMYQNYLQDLFSLRFSRLNDGTMQFTRPGRPASRRAPGGWAW
jgi:cation diffusion facilitator CzcD-associated flavoprotein CzcO